MSTNLRWSPVVRSSTSLPDELKFIIRERYELPRTFDCSDIDYLEGLRDGKVKGADELIEALSEYGEVKVFEE